MKALLKTTAVAVLGVLSTFNLVDAAGHKEGDFILRAGVAHISPNDDSSNVLSATDGVSVDSATGIGFSGTWMLTDNWGFEVLASLPFEHDINGTGSLSGVSIGSTKHLPPTFSFQYYLQVESDTVIPYFGLGINYTKFFSEKVSPQLTAALGTTNVEIELDDSLGLAGQFGADWKVSKDFYVNTSIWYMQIDTEATVKVNGAVATTVDVDIDPWVAMIGFAWKF